MVDNEQLKCTATLPLYINSESAVSWSYFSALLLTYFQEIYIFGFPYFSTREDLSIDASITNVGLIAIDKAKVISARQHKSKFNFEFF